MTKWGLTISHVDVQEYPSEAAARAELFELEVEGFGSPVLMCTDDRGDWIEAS